MQTIWVMARSFIRQINQRYPSRVGRGIVVNGQAQQMPAPVEGYVKIYVDVPSLSPSGLSFRE